MLRNQLRTPAVGTLAILFALVLGVPAQGQGIITTYAGGIAGVNPATDVALSEPNSVVVDANGNLYVSTYYLHVVYRITPSGEARVFAGRIAMPGFSGDGGPATSAGLYTPRGLAVDAAGNVYIADSSNARIRRVDAVTGTITTVAGGGGNPGDGGPATEAYFAPVAVAVDASGNLYIAEPNTGRIRRVDHGTGTITTVAGGGVDPGDGGLATSAALSNPFGVELDASGDLYIADSLNHRVRRVSATTGIITTVAGGGQSGLVGDGGPATEALLSLPTGVAFDSAGHMFVAEAGGSRIRRVDASTGVITTIAGVAGHPTGFGGDGGPATGGAMNSPIDLAFGPSGDLYIADFYNCRVRKIDAPTSTIQTVVGNGWEAFAGEGIPATRASLYFPGGIAVDALGNLFIADSSNRRVRRVDAVTRVISTVAGNGLTAFGGDGVPATSVALGGPGAVAVDASGNVYIADTYLGQVRVVDPSTGIISTVPGAGSAMGIAVSAQGSIYFAETGAGVVRRFDPATGVVSTVAGTIAGGAPDGDGGPATSASVPDPRGIALDASGNLFIGSVGSVRRVDAATGTISTVAGGTLGFSGDGGPATAAAMGAVYGVAVDASGNLYIADTSNQRIRRVDSATGIIETVVGNGEVGFSGDGGSATAASLGYPTAVWVGTGGVLYIADQSNHRIRRVSRRPVADAGPDQSVECGSPSGTPVTLQGSNSHDDDADLLAYEWRDGTGAVVGTSPNVALVLARGTHVFTLTVTDPGSLASSDSVTIVVADTLAPSLSVSTSLVVVAVPTPSSLAFVDVLTAAGVTATDGCGGAAQLQLSGVPPGALYPVGDTLVGISAVDDAGNQASVTVTVRVISQTIAIVSPAAASSWAVGTTQTIAWTHDAGSAATFDLDISRDGGPWKRIADAVAASSPSTGSYQWTVVPVASPDVRIRVSSSIGASATSDSFSIQLASPLSFNFEVVHSFFGAEIWGALIQGTDGALYGMTRSGGAADLGTVFRMTLAGNLTTVHEFQATEGDSPLRGVVQTADGSLWGATSDQRAGTSGMVFRIAPGGAFSVVHRLTGSDGAFPNSVPAVGYGGGLYGATLNGGANGKGTIYHILPDGSFDGPVHSFAGPEGAHPVSSPVLSSDGKLYGVTQGDGMSNQGSLYRLEPDGTVVLLHSFSDSTQGLYPQQPLIEATDGLLYGTANQGGDASRGIVYRIRKDGTGFERLHSFSGADGSTPDGGVIQGSDGWLYGATFDGGDANVGTVYRMRRDGSGFERLHSFSTTDGKFAEAALLQASDGAFYGTTMSGPLGGGVIYRLVPVSPAVAAVAPMSVAFGDVRVGSVSSAQAVTVTNTGGSQASVTSAAASGDFQIVNGCTAGLAAGESCSIQVSATPMSPGPRSGTLTVTTNAGGPFLVSLTAAGTAPAVSLTPTGLDFGSVETGATSAPQTLTLQNTGNAPLAVASILASGDFVATSTCPIAPATLAPGVSCSVAVTFTPTTTGARTAVVTVVDDAVGAPHVLSLAGMGLFPASAWEYTVLKSFGPTDADGASPFGGLLQGQDGFLYGTTSGGAGLGTVFKVRPDGSGFSTLVTFSGANGTNPAAELVQATDGTLFGTTYNGGDVNVGTVFRLNPDGTGFSRLVSFGDGSGSYPEAALEQGADGTLYGTTSQGGPGGYGTVFKIAPDGTGFATIVAFNISNGANPYGEVAFGPDGFLYGTTLFSGSSGLLFRVRPDGTDLTTLVSFNGPNGSRPFSGIVVGTDGAIYGTTREGGAFGKGIVFRLDPATLSLSTLLTFTGSNGANPRDGLVLGPDGALYGTTDNAGPSNKGTVFRVGQDGTGFESAVSFDGANGATPVSELIRGIDGALYGTTIDAGPAGGGVAFRLRRHGWPLIQAAPQALSFGSLKVGTTSGAQLVTVSNTGGGSAGVTGTSAAGDFQVTNDCTTALVIAASCSISIRFAPTASGARSGSLTVTTDFGGPFVISLTGTGTAPAVLLSPTSLDFGLSPVGSTTPAQALTLQNTGTAPLAISSIIPSGDFASATDCPTAPATLAPSGSCSMSVTFTPAAAGPRAGTVTITDDATGTPHVVTLSGTGDLPPLASVGPMSIDFGDVRVGQTSSAYGLTLTNVGGGLLTLSHALLTKPGLTATQSGCTPGLGAGASCTISVTYAPPNAGVMDGQVQIQTSAGQVSVSVHAVGVEPLVSIAPSSLDFGSVDVGSTGGPQTVTLQNTGTAPLTISAITLTGDFARTTTCPLAPATLAVGGSCSIEVSFSPTAEGARAGLLSVLDDATGSPHTISLSGAGVAAADTWEYTIVKALALDPTNPTGIIQGSDGALYGTTQQGGASGNGTVFKVNPDGTGLRTLVSFDSSTTGAYPQAGLMQASDGTLYGTTSNGGASGVGTVFKVNLDGTGFATLVSLDSTTGANPQAGLVQGSDGALYGTTSGGGASGAGTVFKVRPDGTGLTTLVSFFYSATTGANPYAALVQGSDGALYGTTSRGGAGEAGTVFKVNPDGTGFATLVSFNSPTTGAYPAAGVVQGADGALYGTTSGGGASGAGTVFKVRPDGTGFTTLVNFFNSATTGANPYAALVQGSDGAFYGTTYTGGASDQGTVFKVSPDGTGFTTLVNLNSPTTGAQPLAGLVEGPDGAFYGTTYAGGASRSGTVFKVTSDGTGFTTLASFGFATKGARPQAALVQGSDGALYGTTSTGGSPGDGTVFKVNLDGTGFTVLVSFNSSTGRAPLAAVVQGSDGALYGMTTYGGASGYGTVFKINPDGAGLATLVSFNSSTTGAYPYAALVQGSDGALYGTTSQGGPSGYGTVFKVNPDGTGFATLVSFNSSTTGAYPRAGVVKGSDGALYGTTELGGAFGGGTVFKVSPDGTGYAEIVSFGAGATTGSDPLGRLLRGADGALYGTTFAGGTSGLGTLFKVNSDGTGYAELANFGSAAAPGFYPYAGLVQGSDGALYGTTGHGGASGAGTAFRVNPDGTGFTTLVNFDNATKGGHPYAGLVQGSDGAFYGTAPEGGPLGGGVVFRLGRRNPATAQVAPSALAFGAENVGTSTSAQTVTVTNTGSGTANATGATVSGDFQITNGCTSGLGAGVSCAIQVVFMPTVVGLRTGTLTVSTDAGGPFDVSLTGTGTAPAVTLAPSSLDFGSVNVGATSGPQTVTLQNTGSAPLTIGAIASTGDFARTTTCPLAPATLAAGGSCSTQVTFTPTVAGVRGGALISTDDAAGSPQAVSLSGTGVVPDSVSPTVALVAPIGGERVFTGTAYVVRWTAADDVAVTSVDVAFSSNGGTTFSPVAGCAGLAGSATSCTWSAPGPTTTQGRIRVTARDAAGNGGFSTSASNFTIVAGTAALTLTAPNTAVTWRVGNTQNINFSHNLGVGQRVSIDVSRDGGATWSTVNPAFVTTAAASGSFAWTVTGPPTAAARARVTWSGNPAMTSTSAVNFTIVDRITITAPNTAVSWAVGSTHNINWSHNLGTSQSVDIDLSRDGGVTWAPVATNVPNSAATTGTYGWVVSAPAATAARIRVSWATNPAVSSVSAVNFTISGTITFTAPTGAPSWAIGSTRSLSWNHTLGAGQSFNIDLSTDGGTTFPTRVATAVPADAASGTYMWVVSGPASTTNRIRVQWSASAAVTRTSGNFTMAAPAITVTAPNTAVNWAIGTARNVTWNQNLGTLDPVNIDESIDGGGSWTRIATAVPNSANTTGTYTWVVSAPSSTTARIRVSWAANGSVFGQSAVNFTVANPFVTVTAPNTAVTWAIGSAHNLNFSHNLGVGQTVALELSRDGGASYQPVTLFTTTSATAGSFNWTVTGPATILARVRATWTMNPSATDVSNVNFRIQ